MPGPATSPNNHNCQQTTTRYQPQIHHGSACTHRFVDARQCCSTCASGSTGLPGLSQCHVRRRCLGGEAHEAAAATQAGSSRYTSKHLSKSHSQGLGRTTAIMFSEDLQTCSPTTRGDNDFVQPHQQLAPPVAGPHMPRRSPSPHWQSSHAG